MGILLSPSTWMSVKPACMADLIPLRIAVASATNTKATPMLNIAACMNFLCQSRMMSPPAATWEFLDSLKLILTNPSLALLPVIHLVCLQLSDMWCDLDGKSVCVSMCLIRHSALACFALKIEIPRIDVSLRTILLFRVFQMLQRSAQFYPS